MKFYIFKIGWTDKEIIIIKLILKIRLKKNDLAKYSKNIN